MQSSLEQPHSLQILKKEVMKYLSRCSKKE